MKRPSAAFQHRGIFVSDEADVVQGTMFGLQRKGKFSEVNKEEGSIILQEVQGKPRWRLTFQTHAYLPDGKIEELGRSPFSDLVN
jgi:hypothetical protein